MPAKEALDSLSVPEDLLGERTLDVGAWDGPLTFEMERRGADAAALDIQDPERVGYATARRVMGMRAPHYRGSVYDLPTDDLRDLDRIIFRGVYYHLKHPILAFERLSMALRMGGSLHFEGEGLLKYAETLKGVPAKLHFKAILESNAPVCLIYPNAYKKANNWFVPTPAGLEACMIAAGLEVAEMHTYTSLRDQTAQRLYGRAVKVRENAEILEHPLY